MSGADSRALLLAALSPGADRAALVQQALQQSELDPATAELVARYLGERAAGGTAVAPDDEAGADMAMREIEARDTRIRELAASLEEVGDKLRRIYPEVEHLRTAQADLTGRLKAAAELGATLAAALGVCPDCLGEDEGCPVCRGQGFAGSGFFAPDERLFRRFVVPAARARAELRRLRAAAGAATARPVEA